MVLVIIRTSMLSMIKDELVSIKATVAFFLGISEIEFEVCRSDWAPVWVSRSNLNAFKVVDDRVGLVFNKRILEVVFAKFMYVFICYFDELGESWIVAGLARLEW